MADYQRVIESLDPTINPVGVEASMRLQYGTLDHLGHETFVLEIKIARSCEREEPGHLRRLADSYGLVAEFDDWKIRHDEKKELEKETRL